MKILHTSDWHLGKILHEHSLLEDQEYILNEILKIIEADPHDAMIIAGDIYDRSIPPADAVKILSDFLKSLLSLTDMPVLIIPGNHDSSTRLSYLSEIISMAGIYIKTDPEDVNVPVTIKTNNETAHVFLMPFLAPSAYDIHKENEERSVLTHQGSVEKAISMMNLNKDNLNILVGHLFTSGGKISDSERKFIGTSGEIDKSIIDGFDYVALGHLHRPQNITDKIYYSGSPLKYSFSESENEKVILSVEVTKKKVVVTEKPLKPKYDLTRLNGSLDDLLSNEKYEIYTNDYLEVELTDEVLFQNPIHELKKKFKNILSVRRPENISSEGINIPETVDSRDIEDDFITFHQFIHENETPDDDKLDLFRELRKEMEDS